MTRIRPPVLHSLVVLLLALGSASDRASAQDRPPLTLSEAAASALDRHPSQAAAAARVEGASEELERARARRLPGIQLEASATRFEEPMIVAPLHSFDPTTRPRFDESLVQGRLGLAYTVFDGGARSAGIDGAGAGVEAARHGRDAAEMQLLERVAGAYLELITAHAVRDAALAQRDALELERDRAEQQVEAGTSPRVQALRAGAALEDARARLAGTRAHVALAERELARLMGVEPEDVAGRALAGVAPADPPDPAAAPEANPRVASASRQVEAAEARVAGERAARLPRLDAGAVLQDFGTLTGRHVFEWQAGVQVSWPLFTGGARSASVRRAEAGLREARADLARVELEVDAAVDAASTAVTEADARAEALEAAVLQWAEVARIEALALEAGAGVQSDLLQAQAGLFQARAGLAGARSDAALARVRVARARGTLDTSWIDQRLENR